MTTTVSQRNRVAANFLDWYSTNHADNEAAAAALEAHVSQLLADANLRALMVTARAKTLESVRGKLLRKHYRAPRSQVTDRLGLRVIVYHGREVDSAAAFLRTKLEVEDLHSSDKRLALGLREFGYRSYHLVASLPTHATTRPHMWSLRGQTFEVQIRSLLEHVWAEIEHDVVYKSGADWPKEIRRRFAAIAGVLELLEHEFDELASATSRLIEHAVASLKQGMDPARNLDVPGMCALVELEYPDGVSFRGALAAGSPFPPGIDQRLQLGLRRSAITTLGGLLRALRSNRVRRGIRRYAGAEGILKTQISHLAVLAIVLGLRSRSTLRVFFPELEVDTSMRIALDT